MFFYVAGKERERERREASIFQVFLMYKIECALHTRTDISMASPPGKVIRGTAGGGGETDTCLLCLQPRILSDAWWRSLSEIRVSQNLDEKWITFLRKQIFSSENVLQAFKLFCRAPLATNNAEIREAHCAARNKCKTWLNGLEGVREGAVVVYSYEKNYDEAKRALGRLVQLEPAFQIYHDAVESIISELQLLSWVISIE